MVHPAGAEQPDGGAGHRPAAADDLLHRLAAVGKLIQGQAPHKHVTLELGGTPPRKAYGTFDVPLRV